MPKPQRSLNRCYEDFVQTGLPISGYTMYEIEWGYWIWITCSPKPSLIAKLSKRKYDSARRRLANAQS